MNKICKLLDIKYPIIQGAMANIADAELASSVSNAGGLGIIASGGMSADKLREEIKKCKKLTDKPFGVNLMLKAPNKDELIKVVMEEKPTVVTTGAGSPKDFIGEFKKLGIKVIPVIASVKHAVKMESLGADALIAEGTEAGGHIGENSTLPLVQSVVASVNIPVVAAGGIYDGKGLAAMLLLGAGGVQMGTRFLLSTDCNIDKNYKEAIKNATETVVTGRNIGIPVRCLPNKMTEEYIREEKSGKTKEELEHFTLGALKKAVAGDVETGSLMSGQIVSMVNKEASTSQIIEEIMYDAEKTLVDASTIEIR